MDRILRIDMGAKGGPEVKETAMEDYSGLAGRALTSALVSKEVPPNCHPLGKDNKIGHCSRASERNNRSHVRSDLHWLQESSYRRN